MRGGRKGTGKGRYYRVQAGRGVAAGPEATGPDRCFRSAGGGGEGFFPLLRLREGKCRAVGESRSSKGNKRRLT